MPIATHRALKDQPLLQQPNGRHADDPHRLLAMLARQGNGMNGFHEANLQRWLCFPLHQERTIGLR
jgi:hypothetical protein